MKYLNFLGAIVCAGLSYSTAFAESHENCGNNGSCTFYGVNQDVWACMRSNSEATHNTIYSSDYPNTGLSTTQHAGKHVFKYSFDTSENSATYKWREGGAAKGIYWTSIYKARNDCKR